MPSVGHRCLSPHKLSVLFSFLPYIFSGTAKDRVLYNYVFELNANVALCFFSQIDKHKNIFLAYGGVAVNVKCYSYLEKALFMTSCDC